MLLQMSGPETAKFLRPMDDGWVKLLQSITYPNLTIQSILKPFAMADHHLYMFLLR